MWVYNIQTGNIFGPIGLRIGTGYSGHEAGKNNPAMVNVPNFGPIPPGTYDIGPAEDHPHLGPVVMALTPHETNVMYGRSGFFIHGDSGLHPGEASHGCIIQGAACRRAIAASPDKILE